MTIKLSKDAIVAIFNENAKFLAEPNAHDLGVAGALELLQYDETKGRACYQLGTYAMSYGGDNAKVGLAYLIRGATTFPPCLTELARHYLSLQGQEARDLGIGLLQQARRDIGSMPKGWEPTQPYIESLNKLAVRHDVDSFGKGVSLDILGLLHARDAGNLPDNLAQVLVTALAATTRQLNIAAYTHVLREHATGLKPEQS